MLQYSVQIADNNLLVQYSSSCYTFRIIQPYTLTFLYFRISAPKMRMWDKSYEHHFLTVHSSLLGKLHIKISGGVLSRLIYVAAESYFSVQ